MKLLLKIMYDGTGYHGFQYQPNAISVQEVLTERISSAFGMPCTVTGCSRTDAGVHALGFCAAVEPADEALGREAWCTMPAGRIHRRLNTVFPDDIAVIGACITDDSFHPRYSALGKEYIYRIRDTVYPDPFDRNRAYQIRRTLSDDMIDEMNRAASSLMGRHDFCGFMASGSSVTDTVRNLKNLSVERVGEGEVILRAEADGFLYNMVRILTGTLLDVAYGKLSADDMEEILSSQTRSRAGFTAPAHGLYLNRVDYGDEVVFLAD